MADLTEARPENAAGTWFVDSSCIDCDACRMIAPGVFDRAGEQSAVVRQPESDREELAAGMALVSCPTSSIGTRERRDIRPAIEALPSPVCPDVLFCGYTSESSFGARSWLVTREEGNLLVDSPRFATQLVRRLESLGGVAEIVLTHRDDVADHEKFARRFGARRWLHSRDVTSATRAVERQPEGDEEIEIVPGLLMIPTPGHTAGHVVYLWRDEVLFTGDHLWWSPGRQSLTASRSVCWHSWPEQVRSLARLLDHRFEWVLPGHGHPVHQPVEESHRQIRQIVERG